MQTRIHFQPVIGRRAWLSSILVVFSMSDGDNFSTSLGVGVNDEAFESLCDAALAGDSRFDAIL